MRLSRHLTAPAVGIGWNLVWNREPWRENADKGKSFERCLTLAGSIRPESVHRSSHI